jgi:hypothetical protein
VAIPLRMRGAQQPRQGLRTRGPAHDGALRPETDDSGRRRVRAPCPYQSKDRTSGVWADSGSEGERVRSVHHGRLGQASPEAVESPLARLGSTCASTPGALGRHAREPVSARHAPRGPWGCRRYWRFCGTGFFGEGGLLDLRVMGEAVSAGVQDLPDDAPERRGRVGFHQVGHAVVEPQGLGLRVQGIPGQEDEPLAELRIGLNREKIR